MSSEVFVYVDGCCLGNGQRDASARRAGLGIYAPHAELCVQESLDDDARLTNQRAELHAVITALRLVAHDKLSVPRGTRVNIVSDNSTVVNAANAGPGSLPRGENVDLLQALDRALAFAPLARVTWTRAHTHEPVRTSASWAAWHGNAMADALSKAACGRVGKLRALLRR